MAKTKKEYYRKDLKEIGSGGYYGKVWYEDGIEYARNKEIQAGALLRIANLLGWIISVLVIGFLFIGMLLYK